MGKFIMVEPKEPYLGYEPKPPKEYREEHNSISIDKTLTIQDLVAKLPKGITIDDIRVDQRERDNGYACWSEVYIFYIKKVLNTTFKSEMNDYEKSLIKFKERKVAFEKEIEQFKLDVKEYLAWAKKEKYYIDEAQYKELKKKYNFK